MSAPAPRLRLAAENGRRVGRTPEAKRLAARPGTDAARLARVVSEVYAGAADALAAAMAAQDVAKALFLASCGSDPLPTRALAREALASSGHLSAQISDVLTLMEQTVHAISAERRTEGAP